MITLNILYTLISFLTACILACVCASFNWLTCRTTLGHKEGQSNWRGLNADFTPHQRLESHNSTAGLCVGRWEVGWLGVCVRLFMCGRACADFNQRSLNVGMCTCLCMYNTQTRR